MATTLKKFRDLPFSGQTIELFHDQNQVCHGKGEGDLAFAYALGYCHGKDRGVQIGLHQALVRGKLSAWLKSSEETIETDRFFLKLGFYYQSRKEIVHLSDSDKQYMQSYCDGLNKARKDHFPWELKLLQFPFEPWQIADSFALMKVMSFLGLAQTQQNFEKFLCVSLGKGISLSYFKSLFPAIDQSDLEELVVPLQKTHFDLEPIPNNHYLASLPTLKGSNNWVIGPERSETGSCMMAADPHLEVNRLPAIWYEFSFSHLNDFKVGISVPGIPGNLMGRNKAVSFSFTYGYMDTMDYFVEEVKEGKVKEGNNWVGLSRRKEILKRKKETSIEIHLFECERGLLEVPENCLSSTGQIKDGFYLSRCWSGHNDGCVKAIQAVRDLNNAQNSQDACTSAKRFFFCANWLFADNKGQTAYQQSGYLPKRKNSGLYPRPGWKKVHEWEDYQNPAELIHYEGRPDEILVTANNDVCVQFKGVCNFSNINLPLGDSRLRRVREVLEEKANISLMESKALQNDVKSPLARDYLNLITSEIPNTPSGRLLKEWNLSYDLNSKGAFLFEKFRERCYQGLMAPVWGELAWDTLSKTTTLISSYGHLWDRVLLNPTDEDKVWFHQDNSTSSITEARDRFIKKILLETLAAFPVAKCIPWGEHNSFTFSHIIFGKMTPHWFPCNSGPHGLKGCGHTVHQGSLFKDQTRNSSFAPSWRMVTDMGQDALYTSLPGGPSDRITKKSYRSEISNWLNGQYKTLLPR